MMNNIHELQLKCVITHVLYTYYITNNMCFICYIHIKEFPKILMKILF